MFELFLGVFVINVNGFAHFDLKPENILIDDQGILRIGFFFFFFVKDTFIFFSGLWRVTYTKYIWK
jgi:hypothetical protein